MKLTGEQVKAVVRDHWNGRADAYDAQGLHHAIHNDRQRAAWLDRVRAWAPDSPGDVLDIGCGTGFFTLLTAALGHRPSGIDIAPDMLANARRKCADAGVTADLRLGDAEHLPWPQDTFDLAIERHVIWTLPHPQAALTEWRRVLRPGATLVLVEGRWRTPAAAAYQDIAEGLPLLGGVAATALRDLVHAAGYASVAIESLGDEALWNTVPDFERYAIVARA